MSGEESLRAWLQMFHSPGIGAGWGMRLADAAGGAAAALGAGPEAWRAWGLPASAAEALATPSGAEVEADLEWATRPDHHLICPDDPRYPALLRQIHNPPLILFVRGDPEVLAEPQLAVVGSRNPTAAGRRTATDFAAHLAAAGLTITSGLALGIDAAAHRGALRTGRTVAVCGTGLDRVYPASHRDLAHRIAAAGALVSEFPRDLGPGRGHFPRRNRIISGLGLGTLVVEAALHSGSLITAQYALEQGREVFAIPGSIHNPLARGCHRLLREGARLVETADDILGELAPLAAVAAAAPAATGGAGGPPATGAPAPGQDPDYTRLLESLGFEPTSVDDVVARSGLTAEAVSSMLLILELRGDVASSPGGLYARVPK